MSESGLPAGSYLASHYRDRRGYESWRVYYLDGRVDAFDGREWWTVCRFDRAQIEAAQQAVRASGLLTAADMPKGKVHDAARLSWYWELDGRKGSVTNYAYPAHDHPAFLALDERLEKIEAAAGAEQDLEP